jgi:Protein of unknown function (DUF2541)
MTAFLSDFLSATTTDGSLALKLGASGKSGSMHMFRRLVIAGLALATAGAVGTAGAQQGEKWVLLGTKVVDAKSSGTEVIDLARGNAKYKAVRVQNKAGDTVTFNKSRLTYGDNSTHLEERNINLQAGQKSRPLDPRDGNRAINSVAISFTQKPSDRATLEVWGLMADEDKAAPAAAAASTAPKPSTGPIAAAPTSSAAATAAPGTVSQSTGGDVLFGSQTVGFGVDRDVIRVGAEVGKFDKIRLRVLDNDIFLNEMKVVYANGESETLAVAADVKQNTRTKWFNLKGDRFIKEIQLVYRARPNFRGQAHVEVFGEYAEGWLGPVGEGRKFNSGWVMLGAQSADFFRVTSGKAGFDRDVIPVGKNEGGFKKIRVNVRDRAITLNELRVVYTNGTEDIIPIKTKVEAGAAFGPLDLKNGGKPIKEILAYYRSRIFDAKAVGKGKAIVEVWGQH